MDFQNPDSQLNTQIPSQIPTIRANNAQNPQKNSLARKKYPNHAKKEGARGACQSAAQKKLSQVIEGLGWSCGANRFLRV